MFYADQSLDEYFVFRGVVDVLYRTDKRYISRSPSNHRSYRYLADKTII